MTELLSVEIGQNCATANPLGQKWPKLKINAAADSAAAVADSAEAPGLLSRWGSAGLWSRVLLSRWKARAFGPAFGPVTRS